MGSHPERSEGSGAAASEALVEYLLRLGDDRLVLGHRLSEWTGHAPILEEDIALANIALDLIGQANLLLGAAAEAEGKGRNADALAYFRDAGDFRNVQLVELPRGDFGFTIARQFLFDAYDVLLTEALSRSSNGTLAGIMAKANKEARYHYRHSAQWVIRLGDGTDESHQRVQRGIDACWPFIAELFEGDAVDAGMSKQGIGVDPASLRKGWDERVQAVLKEATLTVPSTSAQQRGGRTGAHTEHLGAMLAEMQVVARAHPNATW